MANPNNLAPKVDTQVLIVTGASSAAGFSAPLFVSEFVASVSFPTRIKSYTGTRNEKLALLESDGFDSTTPAHRQVTSAQKAKGAPETIWIGRRDVGDADWDATMTAIDAENSDDWYAFCIDSRDSAPIQQASAWAEPPGQEPKFAFFFAETDSAQVRDGSPGSFDQVIAALARERTALAYHDSAIASGLAPATISSRPGPFVFGAAESLSFRFDGGATQPYSFAAGPAVAPGSIAETFNFTAGGVLEIAANGLAAQSADMTGTSATLLSGASEPFVLTAGATLLTRVDGAAAATTTVDATPAIDLGTGTETFAIAALDQLDIKINAGGTQSFIFAVDPTASAQDVADFINLTATGFSASDVGGAVELRTDRQGTGASLEVEASSTGALLTELGLVAGTEVGGGDVADISAVTAAELAGLIAADTAGATAVDESGQVRITADSIGKSSRLQVTGGIVNDAASFPTDEASGGGPFADATAGTAAEVASQINGSIAGIVASVDGSNRVVITSTVLGTSSSIVVTAGSVQALLGLTAGTTSGTGDFANIASVSASELALAINNAGVVDGTVTAPSGTLTLASLVSGPTSSAQIITDSVGLTWTGDGFAVGIGTDDEYADCFWVAQCITFALDSENGAALWDNQDLGAGVSPDPLTAAQKVSLDQRRVNAIYLNGNRTEGHWGYMLRKNGPSDYLYIDERTTADWLDARYTEDQNTLLNNYSDAKRKIPFNDNGFSLIAGTGRGTLKRSDRNGHTTYDGSALDLTSDTSTGVFFPRFADLSQSDIDQRRYAGVRIRQAYKGGVQRISSLIELRRPPVQL